MSNVDIEQTKNLVQRYFEALINRKDLSICDEMLAPSYVDHADSYPPAPEGTPPGPESIKEYVSGFLDDHPDMHTTVEEVIAEGDKAAARLIWRGTNRHRRHFARWASLCCTSTRRAGSSSDGRHKCPSRSRG
jgi:ketosteroid isomerase-like protein